MAYEMPILDISQDTASTNFLQYRVVTVSGAGVVHTTAASGVRALGVSQAAPTASTSSTGTSVPIRVYGVSKVEASSLAVARGNYLRATSGAVAAGSRLGGTVRPTTNATQFVIGIALTSCAAGTGRRYISMLLTHAGRCSTA